jgi:hypothetical protein
MLNRLIELLHFIIHFKEVLTLFMVKEKSSQETSSLGFYFQLHPSEQTGTVLYDTFSFVHLSSKGIGQRLHFMLS